MYVKRVGKRDLETHHIKRTMRTNSFLMTGHIHQNQQSNVVQLCKKCHQNIICRYIPYSRRKQTTQGCYFLIFAKNQKSHQKKYNSETILKYKTIYDQNKKLCKQMMKQKKIYVYH